MKFAYYLLPAVFSAFIIASCAEQTALTRENQEKGSETNVNALFLEKQETEADVTVKHRILIIPFDYKPGKVKYPNPEIYSRIFFTSFYNLFSILPSIDLPDKNALTRINIAEDAVSNLAKQYSSDFIVYGDYSLSGPRLNPAASVNLMIWDKFSGRVLTNSLTTPTDADLFDSIDSMLSGMVRSMLNEEMKISYLNFNNFDTGNDKIGVFINHRLVAEPVSNNFQLDMKIISGQNYKVAVRRFIDGKLLNGENVNLKPGEAANISATNIRVNLIKNAGFDDDTYSKGTWEKSDGIRLFLSNGECHIKFKFRASGNVWDNSLTASPVKLAGGKRYRVSFKAKASEPEDIYAGIFSPYANTNPYWGIGISSSGSSGLRIPIDRTMKTYTYVFRMLSPSDNNARFSFQLGKSTGDIWLSGVMVEELD
jgi:hypothetical protein